MGGAERAVLISYSSFEFSFMLKGSYFPQVYLLPKYLRIKALAIGKLQYGPRLFNTQFILIIEVKDTSDNAIRI